MPLNFVVPRQLPSVLTLPVFIHYPALRHLSFTCIKPMKTRPSTGIYFYPLPPKHQVAPTTTFLIPFSGKIRRCVISANHVLFAKFHEIGKNTTSHSNTRLTSTEEFIRWERRRASSRSPRRQSLFFFCGSGLEAIALSFS